MTSPITFHTDRHCEACLRMGAALRGNRQEQKNLRARIRRLYRTWKPATSTLEELRLQVEPIRNALHDYQVCYRTDREALARHMEEVG